MRSLCFLVIIGTGFMLSSSTIQSENLFIGKWECQYVDHIYNKGIEIVDSRIDNYSSTISFFSNKTFIKESNGEFIYGKFEQDNDHSIYFFKLIEDGTYELMWDLHWSRKTIDPDPNTVGIDFVFPELMWIKRKDGKVVLDYVDGHYSKLNHEMLAKN